ncbi:pentatricopeptide repeat-containing protein At1g08070, chloroplastic-like [Amborella trichopoda]|uniref:pentatricopeptide repeat-containing protein At1g08070, chloroplastic-like n=1 Tax=Amborella trichopoda TaxID=13333 RepID=UPI0009BEAB28|nr:pentatricopeptide repeat-containing protein At1g08070, chloroplastic-like [Amborella trichopoda]|eukprot:XP_020524850.1 pentatricopeptide repeat-containing protein At1g08070, chloroplastic-like [Amborella trichopoda]
MMSASLSLPHKLIPTSESNSLSMKTHHLFPLLETKFTEVKQLQQVHAQMTVTGLIKHTGALAKFISSLSNFGNLAYAMVVCTYVDHPKVVAWNTIIRASLVQNLPKMAIMVYLNMIHESITYPDNYTFPSLLKASAQLMEFTTGKALHGQTVKFGLNLDLYIETTLIKMYTDFGDLYSAEKLFGRMGAKNSIAWTTLITGYAQKGYAKDALLLFSEMELQGYEPDEVTMATVLSACAELKDIEFGQKIHHYIKNRDLKVCTVLGTCLVDMYAKCGRIDESRNMFDEMPQRNVVSWSAMILGYVQNNQCFEALRLFKKMVSESVRPNEVTMIAVLLACAQAGDLNSGTWVHAYIDKNQINLTVNLQNSLIDMYSKCGSVDLAHHIFENMKAKDLVSWNAMISGLAHHGLVKEALNAFSSMQEQGIKPDNITFIGVLTACSHGGLVKMGWQKFKEMREKHKISPKIEHYGCMVDLLGRAGFLVEAMELIDKMPMEPNGAVWGALLGACRVHNNLELGELAAKRLLEIEPQNDANYVLLSNIYAGFTRWEDVKLIRKMMHERGVRKIPGCSIIEIEGFVHEFLVGDKSHPESESIEPMLNYVMERLKLEGYVAERSQVLLNLDEEEKESSLYWHSEKLALCFGLIKTKKGDPIRILKNLRVCGDCHTAFKLVSRVFKRDIIIRDRSRFHHFRDGSCSCRDFW